jgi:hypothetical protein
VLAACLALLLLPAGASAQDRLRSRPDLRPADLTVARTSPGLAPGLIVLGPKVAPGRTPRRPVAPGVTLADDAGRVRYHRRVPRGTIAADVRVQSYRGRPVLTWWQGTQVLGEGDGEGIMMDTGYRVVKRVRGGDGALLDLHEFTLTPQGTALVVIYKERPRDLRWIGGPRRGQVVDSIVEEVDVATGRRLMRWSSLDDISLRESYERAPRTVADTYDYVHVNSVALDTDGNVLVSARHTSAVYKLDRRSGRLLWRLGGKRSDFRLPASARFGFQHDAQAAGEGVVRVFDNGNVRSADRRATRVLALRLDRRARAATPVAALRHPTGLSAGTQGNAASLAGSDHLLVGWGSRGRVSELAPDGALLFDLLLPPGHDTYRAYRAPWSATPPAPPRVVARSRTMAMSWNGATEVQRWRVLGGASRDALAPLLEAPWRGLETHVRLPTAPRYVAVEALDAAGMVLRRSAVVRHRG